MAQNALLPTNQKFKTFKAQNNKGPKLQQGVKDAQEPVAALQNLFGNRVVQRLIARRVMGPRVESSSAMPILINHAHDVVRSMDGQNQKNVTESNQFQVDRSSQEVIQRSVVCDPDNPEICWSVDDALTPSAEPNMSEGLPLEDMTSRPSPEPDLSYWPFFNDPSELDQWAPFNNSVWNLVTNNTVSGGAGLLEQSIPGLSKADDFLVDIASKSRGVLDPSQKLGGLSKASAVLAPLGVLSNAMSFEDAMARPGSWWEKGGDAVSSAAGFFSSAVGTAGLAGAGLEALGAGGALSAGAAALTPAAEVAGSFAAGYAGGRLLDEGVDWAGDKITGDEGVDHSISGTMGKNVYSVDELIHGVSDEPVQNEDGTISPNESYKKTWAYQLGEWLD